MPEMSYNKELKPGIQALVIGCYHPEFSNVVGTTVTLVESFVIGSLEMWRCEEFIGYEVDYIQAKFLMPLYPEADPLSLEIKEKENV